MTFNALWKKIGKQSVADNNQHVTVVMNISDIKTLIDKKPDWECVTIPLCFKKSAGVQYLIIDQNKLQQKESDEK